jgi:hypothetical protein
MRHTSRLRLRPGGFGRKIACNIAGREWGFKVGAALQESGSVTEEANYFPRADKGNILHSSAVECKRTYIEGNTQQCKATRSFNNTKTSE